MITPPGVPALVNPNVIFQVGSILGSDSPLLDGTFLRPRWGIYLESKQVIVADSVAALHYRKEYRISDYPQEQGAFESYNKVTMPYDIRLRMTKGGNLIDRQAFIAAVDKAAATLNLYDIITPEKTYIGANIAHVDYVRQADRGAGLIVVDISLIEIRATVTAQFSNTAKPSGATPVNNGTVQTKPTSPYVTQGVKNAQSGGAW